MLVLRAGIRVSKRVKVRERGCGLSSASRDTVRSGLTVVDFCQGVGVTLRFRD